MEIVGVVNAKGSAGATTLAMGLASRWPGRPAVVVEADPAGGDLTARFGSPPSGGGHEPGLASMALARRADGRNQDPSLWTQPTPLGVDVVAAEPGPTAAASLAHLSGRASGPLSRLVERHGAVIVDGGRWDPASPAMSLLSAAQTILLVLRPSLDQIRQAGARLEGLRQRFTVVLAIVGRGPWPPDEVAAALGVPLTAWLPWDPHGAGILSGQLVPRRGWPSRGWTRLPLPRSCRDLAGWLSDSQPQTPSWPAGARRALARSEAGR